MDTPLIPGVEYTVYIRDAVDNTIKQKANMVFIRMGEGLITFLNKNRNTEETFPSIYLVRAEKRVEE